MPISTPMQPQVHPMQSGQAFAIISGENPKHVPEIRGGHKALVQHLAQSGVRFEATDGHYGDGNSHSPVVITYGLGRDQAMDIGRKMGQESVIFSNAGQHELVYTNGPKAGQYHPVAGNAMQVFPARPDDGLSTRVPGLGHVRFNFDLGKLLDVPHKGSAMSEDTQKSEVSVAEFKRKLADTLRGKIEELSKSMEDFASREVATNGDAAVGDLKRANHSFQLSTIEWDLELGIVRKSDEEVCVLCGQRGMCSCFLEGLSKSTKLSKSHTMAVASAMKRVYDSYLKNVGQVQFPNDPASAHKVALSAAKDWASRAKDPNAVYQMALGHGPEDYNASASAPQFLPADSMAPANPATLKAEPQPHGQYAQAPKTNDPNHPNYIPPKPQGQPAYKPARLPGYGSRYRKDEMTGLCKECKSEVCKCMEKNVGGGSSHVSQTQRKKQNLQDRKTLERLGTPKDVKQFDAALQTKAQKRNALTMKSDDATWKAELARSEDFIDVKNASTPPSSTDAAKKGGPRIKNQGTETPDPAPPTKPVKGNLDEGSGGDVTKGKSFKKDGMPMSNDAASPAIAPLANAELEKGKPGPPMAQPPTAKPTPSGVPMSKPKLPKAPKLGKAALPAVPRTRAQAGAEMGHAMRTGQLPAAPTATPPAPKVTPKPPSDFDANAFKPTGPVSSGLELAGTPNPNKIGGVGAKPPAPGKLPKP